MNGKNFFSHLNNNKRGQRYAFMARTLEEKYEQKQEIQRDRM